MFYAYTNGNNDTDNDNDNNTTNTNNDNEHYLPPHVPTSLHPYIPTSLHPYLPTGVALRRSTGGGAAHAAAPGQDDLPGAADAEGGAPVLLPSGINMLDSVLCV